VSLAERGNAEAQFYLGLMYGAGNGVPQDIVQAHKWYNLSTANSHGTYGKPVSPENITGKN